MRQSEGGTDDQEMARSGNNPGIFPRRSPLGSHIHDLRPLLASAYPTTISAIGTRPQPTEEF